jgi:predicted XRE-type DNA-binding protein
MKQQILNLFFNEGLSQKEIVEKLDITKGYVSQVVTNDSRYKKFKEEKLKKSKIKHNKQIQNITNKKRKQIQFSYSVDDLTLKRIHNQASAELSQRNHLNNENYRKWNYSAYNYNPSKKRYEFNEKLGRSYDVPKYIKER